MRCGRGCVSILFLALACVLPAVRADEPIQVVKIVEHWELTLNSPDATTTAPQITMTFSPFAHLNSHYATFELNHQATPEFAPGGLHLHAWKGEQCLGSKHQSAGVVLNQTSEIIRWKQVLELADGNLELSVTDGDSATWGAFGEGLKLSVPTSLTNLNTYRPKFSVQESGVGFASGRVKRLAIIKLTAYASSGYVAESDVVRVAFQNDQ